MKLINKPTSSKNSKSISKKAHNKTTTKPNKLSEPLDYQWGSKEVHEEGLKWKKKLKNQDGKWRILNMDS